MTTLEKIEFIRSKAIEANPGIKDLVFGVEYRVRKNGMIHKLRKEYLEKNYCGECRQGQLCGQAFRSYKCGYCKKTFSHPNTGVPKYCDGCAEKHGKCKYCACPIEIIGRQIRIADVFLAIENIENVNLGFVLRNQQVNVLEWWDLKNDDLTKQSSDTIDFIYSLLK